MSQEPKSDQEPDDPSEALPAPAPSSGVSSDEKKKHFSFVWFADWWQPAAAARIEAWGDALNDLAECVMFTRPRPARPRVEGCIEVLFRLKHAAPRQRWRRSRKAPRRHGGWEDAARDIYNHAGVRGELETIALALVKRGQSDLALEVVALEEFLGPQEAGPARAHVRAACGHRQEGIAELRRIASNFKLDWW
ncbi:MAG TPA: hypothetical protein VH208_10630, partial [Myxococcaceae bacterium]|nr:hypothetical protein [Myxococcaceae bacterium]